MGRMISWSMRGAAGRTRRGQMPLSKLPEALQKAERDAAEKMETTGASHVLYAVKIYRADGQLATVQFCMNPMSDEEFYRVTGRARGALIYALHRR